MLRLFQVCCLLLLAGCAHSPPDDPLDPLEPVNRVVFSFNDKLDKYALRPAARGYVAVVPGPARKGVNNFFANLFYPRVAINNFLQGKPRRGVSDIGRFLVNTTIGLVGIFDVATPLGLERHHEDFGQTFGIWGIGPGWYLVLPFYGPATNRDFVGRLLDAQLNPLSHASDDVQLAATVVYAVDKRAEFLGADKLIEDAFDPYLFVRGAYLERRAARIRDAQDGGMDRSYEP
ncbi:MAG TPA: VacJ family lipoprotein [Nevskiales bacterium]|nr:VacJ family lipoprotein [Nevskiales bacterium]